MRRARSEWQKRLNAACALPLLLPLSVTAAHARAATPQEPDRTTYPGHNIAANHPAAMGSPLIRTKSVHPVPPVYPGSPKPGVSDTTEHSFLPASFEDWLTQSTMTGDWGGLRTRLTNSGINVSGHYLEDSSGNPVGGRSKNVRYADEFGIAIDFNLKKLTGYDAGLIHFATVARQGLGLGATLPVIDSPQQIFGAGETVRLNRLSWEMPWNKYVHTEIGEINSENDFEQSSMYWGMSLYCQFQSNGICGMPQSIALNSGYGFYPTAHPGAWVKFYPAGNDHYIAQVGIYSVDPTISNTHNAWKLNLHGATGSFIPVQFTWHQGGKDDYTGPLQTNVKLGAYWDTSEVADVYSHLGSYGIPSQYLQDVNPAKIRGRFGGWLQVDHMIERDRSDPARSTAVFGSFTWGDPRTAPAPYYVTWGVVRKGTFASRPNDTFSVGMKILWLNPKLTIWAEQQQALGAKILKPSGESDLEVNYGWRPTPWLVIRPGVQYFWSAGGNNRYRNPLVVDLETGITF